MQTFYDYNEIKSRFGFEPVTYNEFIASQGNINALSNEQLLKIVEIKDDIEAKQDKYGVLYFRPQDYQLPFHQSHKQTRAIFGANQTGKTEDAVAEVIMLCQGIHPFRKTHGPQKWRVVATDLQHGIGEVVKTKFEKLLPMEWLAGEPKKYNGGEWKKIYFKNGSTIEFLSYEMKLKVFEGWVGDGVYFDEPPPRDIYIACSRGLMRYKGIMIFAMTPLDEPWIYDEIFLKADPNNPNAPDVFVYDLDQNKYISDEAKAEFASKLDDDEKEARLHGQFRHLSGRIYKEFEPMKHVIDSFVIPKDWTRYCAQDYHPQKHCFIQWIAVDPRGRAYVYDELNIDKSTLEIAKAIYDKEGTEYEEIGGTKATELPRLRVTKIGDFVCMRFIDPLSATKDRTSNTTPQRDFLRHGLGFRAATKNFSPGKNAVKEYLSIDKENKPFLYFFRDKVPMSIKAMSHYSWENYKRRDMGSKEVASKDIYSEPADCTRYILVTRPKHRVSQGPAQGYQGSQANSVTGYSYGAED